MTSEEQSERSTSPDLFYLIAHDEFMSEWTKIYSAHGDREKGMRSFDLNEVYLLSGEEHKIPDGAGFFSIGNLIYIVGGWYRDVNRDLHLSDHVYVFDTVKSRLISEVTRINPRMLSPKKDPIVVGPLCIPQQYSHAHLPAAYGYYVFSADLAEHDMEVFESVAGTGFWSPIIETPPTRLRTRFGGDPNPPLYAGLPPTLVSKYAVVEESKSEGRIVYIIFLTRAGEIFVFNVTKCIWRVFPNHESTKLFTDQFGLGINYDSFNDEFFDKGDATVKNAWRYPQTDFVPVNDNFCHTYLQKLRYSDLDKCFKACLPM